MSDKKSEKSVKREVTPFHTQAVETIVKDLGTDLNKGLSTEEANKRLAVHGPNELSKQEGESIWDKIKEQFEDLLVRILLAAAIISFAVSFFEEKSEHSVPGWVEPLVIFSILVLNAIVSIYQDYDAEKAVEALKDLQSIDALCLRDGKWASIPSKDLVPGDVVEINQGDKVPADLRIVQIKTLSIRIEEGNLTGESQAVLKSTETQKVLDCIPAERHNVAFSSTLVSNGSAVGVVVGTGMKTEIGGIQTDLEDTEKDDSPLQKRLEEFGETLAKVITVICILVWVVNIRNFSDEVHGGWVMGALYYFKIAVALAVAAIPEGLPAVITTCLALGSRRMSKEKAIVRKLPSVETLGCTTVICSDKTGTLTTNEMVVNEFFVFGDNVSTVHSSNVTGISYQPQGEVSGLTKGDMNKYSNLRLLAQIMSLNNEAKLIMKDGKTTRSGLPTEAALKVLVEKMRQYDNEHVDSADAEAYGQLITKEFKKLAVLEFTRERKSMSVIAQNKGKNIMLIKGAPDYLIKSATSAHLRNGNIVALTEKDKNDVTAKVSAMAKKGLRTLCIAYKTDLGELDTYNGPNHPAHKKLVDPAGYANFEKAPILLGFVGIQDPPRQEVGDAIAKCRKAGISVIMITGDIKETAQSIGTQIGIVSENQIANSSFTGAEYEKKSETEQEKILQRCVDDTSGLLFSRAEPRHKKLLVNELTKLNQIVAMTGDGVNDAPALKQAHIGVAMGINGTEVAKEASAMILADDNFATIVKAVEEGRAIFSNMKAFIRYMISSNIGEVVSIFVSSVLGIPDGFNSIQLLWVNLVTDGLPATALSFNPPDPEIMNKPPRKHDEPIVTPWVFTRYMVIGTYVGLATVIVFVYWYCYYDWAGDGHTLIQFKHLSNWSECNPKDAFWADFKVKNYGEFTTFASNPCDYFEVGKQKASTLSLTVLVVIEMFNALNALSEDSSLMTVGLFCNPYLWVAIALSISLHCVIVYIPFFRPIFGTRALTKNDWLLVVIFSAPVCLLDEILKFISRKRNEAAQAARKKNE